MTGVSGGVNFDFFGNQKPILMSWTAAGINEGFLALDRNGNGRIDDGTELFGNAAPQPNTKFGKRNGFLALAVYDDEAHGGNGDGWIDEQDSIYPKLVVWVDLNHNGVSEPSELLTLKQAGITRIFIHNSDAKWTDAFGNLFRYQSRFVSSTLGNQDLYDVVFKEDTSTQPVSKTSGHH